MSYTSVVNDRVLVKFRIVIFIYMLNIGYREYLFSIPVNPVNLIQSTSNAKITTHSISNMLAHHQSISTLRRSIRKQLTRLKQANIHNRPQKNFSLDSSTFLNLSLANRPLRSHSNNLLNSTQTNFGESCAQFLTD